MVRGSCCQQVMTFFWCSTAEVAIPEWNPPFKQSGSAPVYPYPEIGNDCSIRVF